MHLLVIEMCETSFMWLDIDYQVVWCRFGMVWYDVVLKIHVFG